MLVTRSVVGKHAAPGQEVGMSRARPRSRPLPDLSVLLVERLSEERIRALVKARNSTRT
jgi:hypothetical protein